MANGVSVRVGSTSSGTAPTRRRRPRTGCCPTSIWPWIPLPRWPVRSAELEHARGQDDRRGEQEREPRRVLPGQAAEHAGHHRDPVPADAGQQREDLRRPDDQRPASSRPWTAGCRPGPRGRPPAAARPAGPRRASRSPVARAGHRAPDAEAGAAVAGRRGVGRRRRRRRAPGHRAAGRLGLGGDLRVRRQRLPGPEPLPGVQDQAVDEQEDRRPDRLAEQHPELVLERPGRPARPGSWPG